MTVQQIVAELENIKEQTLNNSQITTDDVIEAIDDIISDCKDNSLDFTFEDEDDYGSYERETDFTQLEVYQVCRKNFFEVERKQLRGRVDEVQEG